MRVIEQTLLALREGNVDKVFEIDLVEVATGQYVVNFRHGRRGVALADGTKTPSPVPLAKARSIVERLVAEKQAGGFRVVHKAAGDDDGDDGDGDDDADDDDAGDGDATTDLLGRLGMGTRDRSIGTAVWAVADRDLREAEPHLRALLEVKSPHVADAAWQHTVVGALVRCGTEDSVEVLARIAGDAKRAQHVRDVAKLAIVTIGQRLGADPAGARELIRPMLIPAVATAYAAGDPAALATVAERALGNGADAARSSAVGLYLLDDGVARPAALAMARIAQLSNHEAAVVRALYRLAELRRDGEMFALLARRIDAHTGYRPFGVRTRQYFRRRVARVLKRLGRAGSPDYVPMASAVLRSYSDADAEAPRNLGATAFDRFAKLHALNEIVYGNSKRYRRSHHTRSAWCCIGNYQPGSPAPAEREERFPALWDAAPAALWDLVVRGRATPVLELATRALRANAAFVAALSDDALAAALGGGHPLAQRFAYEAVKDRPLTAALARGALASDLTEAHVWVLLWIASNPERAAVDSEMIALLVTGNTPAVRDAAAKLLDGRALSQAVARSAAARSLAILLGLDASAQDRAAGAVAIIVRTLADTLRDLGAEVLRDMIRHPLSALGELAGELMLRHAHRDDLPHDLLESLLASPHAAVRAKGAQLIATTPPEVAKDDLDVLEMFATSPNAELRDGTRPLLAAIARDYPEVARALADRLVDLLLKKQDEGVPAHIVSLLREELAPAMPVKPAATVLRLAGALSPHAREAAGLLLAHVDPDELDLQDLARLASNEILSIRQGAWNLARRSVARYRVAPVAVSRLVDSPWQDTRAFATAFIRELGDALTAEAVIAICDSVRPEVQALGKALLHERFTEATAGTYLVRLAEHPSTNLQLLVSGLLEHHVGGDLARLETIAPYLVTVLCQVNRGAVAKQRVMTLLRREATRSIEHARLLAPILDRQSATIAVTQKHPLIATMVAVGESFPEVPLPITVVPPPSEAVRDPKNGGL